MMQQRLFHNGIRVLVILAYVSASGTSYAQAPSAPMPVGFDPNAKPVVITTALPKKLTSLLFTPNELAILSKVKMIYGRQSLGEDEIYNEEDLLAQLQNLKLLGGESSGSANVPIVREVVYGQFYLESIIYHSPTDWKIRVREDNTSFEYQHETASIKPDFKVVSLSKEQVTFEWRPIDWRRIQQTYKNNTPAIFLDEENKTVIFSLMVNQTLFSYDMTMREGRMQVLSMVVDKGGAPDQKLSDKLLQELFAPDKSEEEKAPEEMPLPIEPAKVSDNNKGLSGLIGAYEKLDKDKKP